MSPEPKKTLPRIRTFAQDLEQHSHKGDVKVVSKKNDSSSVQQDVSKILKQDATVTSQLKIPIATTKKEAYEISVLAPAVGRENPVDAQFTTQEKETRTTDVRQRIEGTDTDHFESTHLKEVPEKIEHGTRPIITTSKNEPLIIAGGTIITDTKKNRIDIVSASITAMTKWFAGIEKSLREKPKPTYTVNDTERRKGVIQKATSKTGTIFSADSETLKDEIRRRQAAKVPQTKNDISWSPQVEVGYPLLEDHAHSTTPTQTFDTTIASVTEEPIEPMTPVVLVEENPNPIEVVSIFADSEPEAPPQKTEPLAVSAVEPSSEWTYEPPPKVKEVVKETIVEIRPEPLVTYTPPVAVPVVKKVATVKPVIFKVPRKVIKKPAKVPRVSKDVLLTVPEAHFSIQSIGNISAMSTNTLSLWVVGVVTGIIALIFVIQFVLTTIIPTITTQSIIVPPAQPLTPSALVSDIVLEPVTQEQIKNALTTVKTDALIQEFRFVNSAGVPLSTNTLTTLFGFNADTNLLRSITDLRLIMITNTRGIQFTVTDPTTAFGSLLAWEASLVNDLSQTLSIDVPLSDLIYTDRTVGQTDIRVLMAGDKQVLVYGFVDKNVVLITTDVTSFTTVLGNY